jgi:isopentenyldiphosphate isomerase
VSFLDRIREANTHDLSGFLPFRVDTLPLGWVRPAFADKLAAFPDVFAVADDHVAFAPGLDSPAARTEAVGRTVAALAGDGVLPRLRGEPYRVGAAFTAPRAFLIDRAAVIAFGIRAYGLHVNGFVRDDGGLKMWIGRRSPDKPTYPGMLDNMVAGGQPAGLSLATNLVKEAAEEADIPEALARTAKPVGAISYCQEVTEGLKPDVQYCYDLEVPAEFVPRNTDGEIAEFYLWPIERVAECVRDTTDFKFNCNLVVIDFLIRHGLIPPDHPDYLDLVQGLRQ